VLVDGCPVAIGLPVKQSVKARPNLLFIVMSIRRSAWACEVVIEQRRAAIP
jgi:hypothetical protein